MPDPAIHDAYCTCGSEGDERLDAADLLVAMDRSGISTAMIAPDSREMAFENASGNARIAGLARAHPGRFLPGFSVNPWSRNAVEIAESARASGGRVLILAPHRQGCLLADEVYDALLAWASARSVPVYAHAAPSSSGNPAQLFFLADRHPSVRFLLGRCGTTDYSYDMAAVLDLAPGNVWYDFGFVRPSAMARYAAAAPGRFCFASCAPQNDADYELSLLRQQIPAEALPGILGGNFQTFLGTE